MKDLIKKFWPYFSIAFVVILFFWKFFVKGLIPFPGDFVVGVYYPWLDYKWGYDVGVPVKNPIMADVPSFIYPMQTYAVETLKKGQLPLWNPLILGGVPLLANFQSAPFSPTNFIYFIFDKVTAWGIQVILQHFLAALFAYFLLRHWKVSKLGSVFGGIVYAFSGYNLIWSQWNGHALTASFIPLSLFLVDKWLLESRWYWGLSLSVVILMFFISGYPQTIIYMGVAVSILWLVRVWREKRWFGKTFFLAVFLILGVGLASPQILPGWDLLKNSQRVAELHPYEWAFLPWRKFVTFLAPDFYGNHATGNYWGPQDYTSNTGFVGVVAFSLALFVLHQIRKSKEVLFGVLLVVFALVLAFPTPVSIFLWKSGIFGLNAASAHRSLILWNLAIAILAGFGFDKIKNKYLLVTPLIILAGFGIYAFKIHQIVGLRNLILPSLVLVSMAFIVFILPKIKYLIIPLAILELFYFSWKFTPFSPRELIFPETPVITFLKSREKPSRVVADRVIPINFLMNYGIETLEGYDAVYPRNISEYIAKINGSFGSFNSIRRYGIIDNYESPLLDSANVKYLVIKAEDVDKYLKNGKFKIAFKDKSVVVLENKNARSEVFVDNEEIYISTTKAFYNGIKISAASLVLLLLVVLKLRKGRK
ncbi:MAG: hypothetical protein UU32_C0042G0008 [Candidatus Woesebacteria bacterium GW2011_GWB1_41_10]|uniref:Glycosyltransferase RgtA/B/C/D-like domain-containing protein n=1 Tax=Candidatus Woesebacteria bacterium GW2011_GWB1_41_10 TaxID=1618577 RepID=A0A0G0WKQ5_9BACT|nr:MAG: hypothetical protein UU32_C0042G0008 [Candidatus Woesebacteria bacterium GW2011_GWB1_41_10]